MSELSLETYASNLKSVAFTVLELLEFNAPKFRGPPTTWPWPRPFQGLLKNIFFGMLRGGYVPFFGEDRSKTGLTILAVVVGWTDTGRTLKWILSNAVDCIGQTIIRLAPRGTDGRLLLRAKFFQVQSHVTQKLGETSKIHHSRLLWSFWRSLGYFEIIFTSHALQPRVSAIGS